MTGPGKYMELQTWIIPGTGSRGNSYHVFDASYVRIKNLTIGYNLPDRVCNSLTHRQIKAGGKCPEFIYFYRLPRGTVPQANFYNGEAGEAQFGVDYGSYPLAKILHVRDKPYILIINQL